MTWLVTGGAGYIGSHVVRAFEADGIDCVVIDDLSSGHREFVGPDVPFVEGSVVDRGVLHELFGAHEIDGVVHLAGFKYAGVSVQRPLHTYTENVTGMISLLAEMAEHDVARHRLLLQCGLLRHARHRHRHRAEPDPARVAVR